MHNIIFKDKVSLNPSLKIFGSLISFKTAVITVRFLKGPLKKRGGISNLVLNLGFIQIDK